MELGCFTTNLENDVKVMLLVIKAPLIYMVVEFMTQVCLFFGIISSIPSFNVRFSSMPSFGS
jgi:hypothetical protein